MQPLAEKALEAVNKGEIKFIPDNFRKIFLYWMENTLDWNISRQIVWGIPIPAWFKGEEVFIGDEAPGSDWVKDTDTFDTWFSSGQWPHLVLDYPDGSDFKNFYPTDVMETGHDLIFKWIPRMVIFGLYATGRVPFHTVYLHGLVNDGKGQKMSKSKGNVMSPLELSAEFGTDALRMALIVGNAPGTDLALAKDKIKAYKHFANKLWNISRFILENTAKLEGEVALDKSEQELEQEKDELLTSVTNHLENYRYHLAAEELYHYTWHRLADEIIEDSKKVKTPSRQQFLRKTLKDILIVLHPFMPFITEELWSIMNERQAELLLIAAWPIK